MKRREFIMLIAGAATAFPLAARAQQPALPVVGYIGSSSAEVNLKRVAAFRKGLAGTGFVEGRNMAIEFRWAGGREERQPELVADLVRRGVAVIAAPANTAGALAAKAATATIPIVFSAGGDPVALGLVASMNRPGGNVTGINILNVELTAKRLGLLRELAPRATRLAALANPGSVMVDGIVRNVQASAPTLGLPVEILRAGSEADIDTAFAELSRSPGAALLVSVDPFFFTRRAQLTALAARHAIPTIYYTREFTEVGGLISYGTDIENVVELTGVYTGRVLKGEKPADLPVAQPTKFEMVINLKAAKALGLDVPDKLLALADGVIE
jgi:putative ABC transport system substrate-binding protein